mmetsp:Transcript_7730/g.11979  ORF Transcript_7730/g.11979 Transcript_7730/m.11979 type:complete len:283 (-) Transcript_7730:1426-2274(-)
MYSGSDDEEMERKLQFVKLMISLSESSTMLINATQRIQFCIVNMSPEQYVNATTTLMAWNKLDLVGAEIVHILDRLKEENISLKFDTTVFSDYIKQISELHFKIEKMFVEKTPEELTHEKQVEQPVEDKQKYQLTAAQLERQKLLQQAHKLDLRHQSLRMSYGIIALKALLVDILGMQNQNSSFAKKIHLIYGRLMDIVFKLDHIEAEETGREFLNVQEMLVDKRLNDKFDVLKMVWSELADPSEVQQKDWGSILDAVQKDLTQLFNDYKFKRLIKEIEENY